MCYNFGLDYFSQGSISSVFFSIDYFDVDENDIRHMVLCRVIMGNMELLRCGSSQFHPSSEEFDSGVDKLPNPNRYVVWNMNMTSHIYPECAISFKMTSDVEGNSLALHLIFSFDGMFKAILV